MANEIKSFDSFVDRAGRDLMNMLNPSQEGVSWSLFGREVVKVSTSIDEVTRMLSLD